MESSTLNKIFIVFFLAISSCYLSACGGGGGDDSTPVNTGQFIDSPVQGLDYQTVSQSGTTDYEGKFKYKPGEEVTFSLGDVIIGKTTGKKTVTPLDLVPDAADETNQTVTNMLRFLQSLDVDGDLDNGIQITTTIKSEVSGTVINFYINVDDFNNSEMKALFKTLNAIDAFNDGERKFKQADKALEHFREFLGRVDDDGDGYSENQGDCNDDLPSIYPFAVEICGDGIDQDCNGTDLDCPVTTTSTTTTTTIPATGLTTTTSTTSTTVPVETSTTTTSSTTTTTVPATTTTTTTLTTSTTVPVETSTTTSSTTTTTIPATSTTTTTSTTSTTVPVETSTTTTSSTTTTTVPATTTTTTTSTTSTTVPVETSTTTTSSTTTTTVPATTTTTMPIPQVGVFYYPWYGNPAHNGEWMNWDLDNDLDNNYLSLPHDISSDYYPVLGAYSSIDPEVVAQHFAWLRDAKVNVIITSWWKQHSPSDRAVPLLLDIADQYGIKVAFHIEPYPGRTAQGVSRDISYLYSKYGQHPAFYRTTATSRWSPHNNPKGLFFLWMPSNPDLDSDSVEAGYWREAMDAIHAAPNGGLVIAHNINVGWIDGGHFDGLYNYVTVNVDQTDGFAWARDLPEGAWFVPSVIPGFSAQRTGNPAIPYEPRRGGDTYDQQWATALGAYVQPALVTITSFNEWHEGTQIEPATQSPGSGVNYTYKDYLPLQPDEYLVRTRQWVEEFQSQDWPVICPARLHITSTSDWTVFGFKNGVGWLRPEIVSASPDISYAGLGTDSFLLMQPLAQAEAGGEMQVVVDVDFAVLDGEGLLEFYINRGYIGETIISIMDLRGNEMASFEWSGVYQDSENIVIFDLPAAELGCR